MNDSDLYNAIRKEAIDSNYYGGKAVGNDTLLYKFIAEQAKEVGDPLENTKIFVNSNNKDNNLYTDNITNKLIIGAGNFSTDGSLTILRGTIKHELWHHTKGAFAQIKGNAAVLFGYTSSRKKEECEADFAAGGDIIQYSYSFIKEHPDEYLLITDHPSTRQRLEASLIKSYIEEKSGVKLNPEDVKIETDCHFTITNEDKLKSIPPKVIIDAKKNAEAVLAETDKAVQLKLKDHSVTIPPITTITKAPGKPASGATIR